MYLLSGTHLQQFNLFPDYKELLSDFYEKITTKVCFNFSEAKWAINCNKWPGLDNCQASDLKVIASCASNESCLEKSINDQSNSNYILVNS